MTAITTVQYDDHTWTVEAGPNDIGYYRLSRTDTRYPHTAHVHGSELTFQPEAGDVLAVVDALYGVYLNREGNASAALDATVKALMTLGWNAHRAGLYAANAKH